MKLLDFWAEWCVPCKQMNPIIEELISEGFDVQKINVDEDSNTQHKYGVMSIPTYIFIKDGKIVETLIGAQSKSKLVQIFKGGD